MSTAASRMLNCEQGPRTPKHHTLPLGPHLHVPDCPSFLHREKDIEAALNGGEGVPCYLTIDRKGSGTLGSRSSSVVCLRRCKPTSTTRDKDVDRECDLGIVCSACDVGFIVSSVDRLIKRHATYSLPLKLSLLSPLTSTSLPSHRSLPLLPAKEKDDPVLQLTDSTCPCSCLGRGGAAWLSQQAPPLGLKGCLLEVSPPSPT